MTRDPRYDILFESVEIGPVTAKNRFYQVPHCSDMGYARPQTLNRAREINAEGGWAVVCTEYCSIHPSANDDPHPQCTLWDENDVKTLADMTERVHRHGALAGVELWYGGYSTGNSLTRENSLAPSSMPAWHGPTQTQAMDRTDIRNLRKWHRDAALRAKRAGFDIVYVYAAHGYLPAQFLSPVENRRSDEYGGSFENRARLIRELLEDTKEAVGDACGVAFRFAVDNLDGLIAEKLRLDGLDVLLVTSASCLSPDTDRTLEQDRIQTQALELGVELVVSHRVTSFDGDNITIACAYSGKESTRACRTLVPVTSREPNDDIYMELSSDAERLRDAGILSLSRIGDCAAPGMIAQAVFAGHRYARELGANDIEVDRDRVISENDR